MKPYRTKLIVAGLFSVFVTGLGAWLRMSAYSLAWPTSYSFGASPENTSWFHNESHYAATGNAFLIIGGVLLTTTLVYFLFATE